MRTSEGCQTGCPSPAFQCLSAESDRGQLGKVQRAESLMEDEDRVESTLQIATGGSIDGGKRVM